MKQFALLVSILLAHSLATIVEYDKLLESKDVIVDSLHQYGYVMVRGVPDYQMIRDAYVAEAYAFSKVEDKSPFTPIDSNSRGWDRGIETFNGYKDLYKGSFYAAYPDQPGNLWPNEEYRNGYLRLAGLIRQVGEQVLGLLPLPSFEVKSIARGLDYAAIPKSDHDPNPFWCGVHRDHGAWTGLASSVYLDPETGERHPEPSTAGLHVRGVKVTIPDDCLAFQVGEVAQLLSDDQILATEHHVAKAYGLQRITMAVFMYPPDDFVLQSSSQAFPERFSNGMTYGEWNRRSLARYKK